MTHEQSRAIYVIGRTIAALIVIGYFVAEFLKDPKPL